jgi:DnaJ-class molecular chaperone
MKYHPDRTGGDAKAEEEFKKVKQAYENLTSPKTKSSPWSQPNDSYFGDIDDIQQAFRRAYEQMRLNVTLRVPIQKAFTGGAVPININGRPISYSLKPGMPQYVTYVDEVPFGDGTKTINVTIEIISDKFKFLHVGTSDGIRFSGDLVTEVDVPSSLFMTGGFTTVSDFTGKQLQVRIPQDHDPKVMLKVAGHGYPNWNGDKAVERGNLYLQLKIIPKSIKDMSAEEKKTLIEALGGTVKKTKKT